MPIEKFDLVLESSRDICPTIKHLAFQRADGLPLDFVPGQFITFLFDVDGKTKRRSYSVASRPDQTDLIEIAVSYVDGGIATERLFGMKPGDQFPAMGPAGRLVLKADDNKQRYVLVGTGTGIAPYRAMLSSMAERITEGNFSVDLVLGARHRCDLLYGEDFKAFSNEHNEFRYHAQLSREEPQEPFENKGYVQTCFDRLNLNPETDAVYLCGNPDMIDECFAELQAVGFESADIRREKYISSN